MDEAIRAYKQAMRLNPDIAEIHNNLGVAYIHKGDIENAVNCFENAVRINPDYSEAKRNFENALKMK